MGKGQGKDDPLSDDGEFESEPVWPKIVAAVLAGTFVIQLIIAIVYAGDDGSSAPAPPPPPSPPPAPPPLATVVEGADAAGNGDAGDVVPPPPPPPPPPPTEDRRVRVSQFVNSMNDPSTIDQLGYFVTPNFQVTFGSGCSVVGGGVFCGEGEASSFLAVLVPVALGLSLPPCLRRVVRPRKLPRYPQRQPCRWVQH